MSEDSNDESNNKTELKKRTFHSKHEKKVCICLKSKRKKWNEIGENTI